MYEKNEKITDGTKENYHKCLSDIKQLSIWLKDIL